MKPVFSIVIPTYNRANVIGRTLDSVLAQTYQDWECLIVDDFSTDNTKDVVEEYCNKDSRFYFIINEKKKGANGARNTGIEHAKGDYVSFLDSDDCWSPLTLEIQKEKYLSDVEFGCVYSDIHSIDIKGREHDFGIPLGIDGHCYAQVLMQGYLVATSALSVKRELVLNIGMFDLELPSSQDDDICFKLAKQCKVGYIPKVLTYMYVSANNRISDNTDRVATGWWMLWNKYESDVLEYCGKDVMVKHYKECLHNFVHANNSKMTWKAYKKCQQYGGCFSIKKRLGIVAYCLSCGKIQYVVRKVQSVI